MSVLVKLVKAQLALVVHLVKDVRNVNKHAKADAKVVVSLVLVVVAKYLAFLAQVARLVKIAKRLVLVAQIVQVAQVVQVAQLA